MPETPMNLLVDCATGAEKYVPLSAEEIAQRELDAATAETIRLEQEAAAAAEEEAKASAIAKLEAVGLTADEIAALTK